MDGKQSYGKKSQELKKTAYAMMGTFTGPGGHEKFPSPPDER